MLLPEALLDPPGSTVPGSRQSIDRARAAAAVRIGTTGCSADVATRAGYVLHPLEDRLFTSFGYERHVRRAIRGSARRIANASPRHLEELLTSTMSRYLAIAEDHREPFYVTRFSHTLTEWQRG